MSSSHFISLHLISIVSVVFIVQREILPSNNEIRYVRSVSINHCSSISILLVFICLLIALFTVALSECYPSLWQDLEINDEGKDERLFRREQFDPYGFNSILTRFYKRQLPVPLRRPMLMNID